MGSDAKDAKEDEKPPHKVIVDGFWIDETPVTNKQFKEFKEVLDTELKYANDNPLTTDYNTQVTLFASGETAEMF